MSAAMIGDYRARIARHSRRTPPKAEGRLRDLRKAAVLVPVIERAAGPSLLLTRRADHLRSHPGQVAFPGGRPTDGETPVHTALREAHEEVALPPQSVEVAGFLDIQESAAGYAIVPVIGYVAPSFSPTPDAGEVADVFEVPLAFLMNPDNHHRTETIWKGKPDFYYTMPYKEWHIWGATAGIVRRLYERVFLSADG